MKKILLIMLCLNLFVLSGCSSAKDIESVTTNKSPSIPYSTLLEIDDYLEAAMQDDTASVYVYEKDEKLSIHIDFNMAGMNYLYAYRLENAIEAISTIDLPIGETIIRGLTYKDGEIYEVTKWETSNLEYGLFTVVPRDIDKYIHQEKSINEIYDYCGFKPTRNDSQNVESNEVIQTIEDTNETTELSEYVENTIAPEQILGTTVHSRAGSQYYVYGVLPYGEAVEIIGYTDNGEWINFMYEGKNAYFESKYFQATNSNVGIIINPAD